MSNNPVKTGAPSSFTEDEKQQIVNLLIKQGKVINPSIEKLNNCRIISALSVDNEIISIGAIKPKTASDFSKEKADLEPRSKEFDWELGYCYTEPEHTRKGYSSAIVDELISNVEDTNLLASTETSGSSMKGILERRGFVQSGKSWKSVIHGNELALFLKESS